MLFIQHTLTAQQVAAARRKRNGFASRRDRPDRDEASAWFGIGAPKNTPRDIVDKLNKEVNAILAEPAMKARIAELGGVPIMGSPAEFGAVIAAETEKWEKVVRFAGARVD